MRTPAAERADTRTRRVAAGIERWTRLIETANIAPA
jgi:hypothetical protein